MSETHFSLSKSNPLKEFTFLTPNSWFKLIRATIFNPTITGHEKDWPTLLANCYLEIKLSYIADKERQKEWSQYRPFKLAFDLYQPQPIIEINRQIQTEFISINKTIDNYYTDLRVRLVQKNSDNFELELRIDYEEHQLKEK
ncbi:MAG: hypothetical protein WCJ19_05270 [bacterium]